MVLHIDKRPHNMLFSKGFLLSLCHCWNLFQISGKALFIVIRTAFIIWAYFPRFFGTSLIRNWKLMGGLFGEKVISTWKLCADLLWWKPYLSIVFYLLQSKFQSLANFLKIFPALLLPKLLTVSIYLFVTYCYWLHPRFNFVPRCLNVVQKQ